MTRAAEAGRVRQKAAARFRVGLGVFVALIVLAFGLIVLPAQAKGPGDQGKRARGDANDGRRAPPQRRSLGRLGLASGGQASKLSGGSSLAKETKTLSSFSRWLSRPVGIHPELLNHGEVAAALDLGAPYGYRLGFKVGLLDFLTVGLLAQWRDPKLGFRWAPELGIAAYRGEHLSLGLRYRYLFHASPAPLPEPEPKDPSETPEESPSEAKDPAKLPEAAFFRRTHYLAGSMVWSSGFVSAGLEAGATYRRELDQSQTILDPHLFSMQWRPMTGVLLRFGDARWGVSFQAMIPSPEVTLRVEWRHSLFSVVKRRDPLSRALERAKARERRLSIKQR